MLEKEINFLQQNKSELIKNYGGKVLVIKGEEVSGAYDTYEIALEAAAQMHGLDNVLIRKPEEAQIEFVAPALTFGLIHANV